MTALGLTRFAALTDGRQSEAALAICRGARRMLLQRGFVSITELSLANGRRADIVALSETGDLWILEIKASLTDFQTDDKWPEYRDFCDRLSFAVAPGFPVEVIPADVGLVLADRFGGDVLRPAPERRLAGARRKAMLLRFARGAALRWTALVDPEAALEPPSGG